MIRNTRLISFALLSLLFSGCSVVTGFGNNLTSSVLNHDDPATVESALPSYLLSMDAFVAGDPKDAGKLLAAAKLYGAYNGLFVDEPERQKRLAKRAYDYAHRALCIKQKDICEALTMRADDFAPIVQKADKDDLPVLYDFTSAWAGWLQVNSGDWNAIAQIPKLESTVNHLLTLDETYDNGGIHLYLGVLHSLRPAAVGGQPELAKSHFEKAIALSQNKNLFMKVLYAKQYARMVFNQDLHDQLLNSVLEASPVADDLTLINTIAQAQAQTLLDEDYF